MLKTFSEFFFEKRLPSYRFFEYCRLRTFNIANVAVQCGSFRITVNLNAAISYTEAFKMLLEGCSFFFEKFSFLAEIDKKKRWDALEPADS